jgi:serine/threonine protein kinase
LERERDDEPMTRDRSGLPTGALTNLLIQLAETPPAEPESLGPRPGDVLGRFHLEREIGSGGFGRVFCATDLELGREVALKVIRPERGGNTPPTEWVRREAEAAAHLRHRNIVTLHDAGKCEGGAYLVYELLRGQTLTERLERLQERKQPLTHGEAVHVLGEVAAALAHAHAAGVVHRDVKPSNIFLETDGGVKLLDLGLAQLAGAIGLAAGSKHFMAPEQGEGAVDARADVYAWGRLAGLLLDGMLPEEDEPQPDGRPPATLRGLARAARARDPALRPPDAGALVVALRRFERRKRRLLVGGTALLVAGLVALLLFSLALRPEPGPPVALKVAVADLEVGGGGAAPAELEAILVRELAAVPGVTLVSRDRILTVLHATGKEAGPRLDRALTSAAARLVGTVAVVAPGLGRGSDGLDLRVEAFDPETGASLARAEEQVTPRADALAPAVKRLAGRVMEALAERMRDPQARELALDRAVSASLEANRRYDAGLRCEERPSNGESWSWPDCSDRYRQALAFDPDFALAHFALARNAIYEATSPEEQRAILKPALDRQERMPPRERAQLHAWQAHLEGDPDRAVEILRRAVAEWGDDARLVYGLGFLLMSEARHAEAIAPLRRAVELDPGLEAAWEELIYVLGLLDRQEELRQLAEKLARLPPNPGILHAELQARGWLGDVDGVLRLARVGAAKGGGAAREDLLEALAYAGRLAEAEALLGEAVRVSGSRAARRLAMLRQLGGRRREAYAILEAPLPPGLDPLLWIAFKSALGHQYTETRNGPAIARIADELAAASDPGSLGMAIPLAYAGEVGRAEALQRRKQGNSGSKRLFDAIVTWRRGGAARALPELRWAAASEGLGQGAGAPP